MKRFKIILFVGLGLGILLLGLGVWFKIDFDNKIRIPDEQPAVALTFGSPSQGSFTSLSIYPDGTIINSQEIGLRTIGGKSSLIWKRGHINREEFDALISYINQVDFKSLDYSYKFAGLKQPDGSIRGSDISLIISVNYAGLTKTANAFGYILEANGTSFIDLPDAFNKVYQRIMLIAETRTKEI